MIPGATAPHVAVHFCATKQSTTMAATSVAHAAPRAAVRASVPQPGRCHAAMRERQPCAVPESPCNQLTVYCCLFAVLRCVVIVLRSSGGSGRLLCGWFARRHSSCQSICQPFCLASWPAARALDEPCCSWCVGDWTATAGVPCSFFLAESQDWSLLASMMMLICPGRRVRHLTFELPLTSGPVDPLASPGFRSDQPDSLVRSSFLQRGPLASTMSFLLLQSHASSKEFLIPDPNQLNAAQLSKLRQNAYSSTCK